jgi:hypothetical protein
MTKPFSSQARRPRKLAGEVLQDRCRIKCVITSFARSSDERVARRRNEFDSAGCNYLLEQFFGGLFAGAHAVGDADAVVGAAGEREIGILVEG